MADVTYARASDPFYIARHMSSASIGQMMHLPTGEAGWLEPSLNQNAGAASGSSGNYKTTGTVVIPKPTSIQFIDGVPVFWSVSGSTATFKPTPNTADFYVGIAYDDASLSATSMSVSINKFRRYDFDFRVNETIPPVIVGTQGLNTMGVFSYGNATRMILSTANEAQKMDMLANNSIAVGTRMVAEFTINVRAGGAGSAPDFNIALASGTNATDFDSVTQAIGMHIDGNSTAISAFSRDGTSTPVAITSTTKTYTTGTQVTGWIDMRNPAACGMFIEGVQVLTASIFNVNSAASPWLPIIHLEKSVAADIFEITIQRFVVGFHTQSVQAV